jgi:hypothetical protein
VRACGEGGIRFDEVVLDKAVVVKKTLTGWAGAEVHGICIGVVWLQTEASDDRFRLSVG